jgi:hypothetical protein
MQAGMVLRVGIAWGLWPMRRFCPYKAAIEHFHVEPAPHAMGVESWFSVRNAAMLE